MPVGVDVAFPQVFSGMPVVVDVAVPSGFPVCL